MWRITAGTVQTTVNVCIIGISPTGDVWKKGLFLEILNSHWLGTILFPLNTYCSWDNLKTLNPSSIKDTSVPPSHFSIHLNKFSHPDNGATMFFWNYGTFNHNQYVVQTPNRSLSFYQHIRTYFYKIKVCTRQRGFGGLDVVCWPLVPKFAGSNLTEAVGFFRAKKSSACLPSEGK